MSGSLYVFSGLDGAGKSTQIDLLVERLHKHGVPVQVLWSRGGYTPGMLWLKRLARRLPGRSGVPMPGPSEQRTAAFKNPRTRWVWQTLAILDLMFLYGVWLRFKLWTGTSIICDRYWQDTELDFQFHFAEDHVASRPLWRMLRWLSPTATHGFLLLIPVNESQRRSVLKNEPFPDSKVVLQQRLERYRTIGRNDSTWMVIDGAKNIADVAATIQSVVLGRSNGEVAGP